VCNPDEEASGCSVIANIDEYMNNDIVIFDREGNVVHLARPYSNDWNGIHIETGERVPTGSYYFVLNLRENTAQPSADEGGLIRGVITIVRK
jgi:gliding motility-associated-like protein